MFSDLGYWWLAYDWKNYLLSCVVCNQDWKGNLFPVLEPPARARPPSEQAMATERSLLLNPFGPLDPAKHLKFNQDGSVEPLRGSRYGRETIRTVGLHRTALVLERFDVTERAFVSVDQASRQVDLGVPTADNTGFKDLHRMGQAGRPFAGAVRAIIRQQLRVTWETLDIVFGAGEGSAVAPRRAPGGWRRSGELLSSRLQAAPTCRSLVRHMTRFVVDCGVVLHLATDGVEIPAEHELLAPTLLRSQTLSALHEAVHRGEVRPEVALDRLARVRSLPIRLLGDAVLRRRAWDLADQLGWAETYDAEYLALAQLQADAFVTLDTELARRVQGIVPTAPIGALRTV